MNNRNICLGKTLMFGAPSLPWTGANSDTSVFFSDVLARCEIVRPRDALPTIDFNMDRPMDRVVDFFVDRPVDFPKVCPVDFLLDLLVEFSVDLP